MQCLQQMMAQHGILKDTQSSGEERIDHIGNDTPSSACYLPESASAFGHSTFSLGIGNVA